MKVEIVYEPITDDITLPKFKPSPREHRRNRP